MASDVFKSIVRFGNVLFPCSYVYLNYKRGTKNYGTTLHKDIINRLDVRSFKPFFYYDFGQLELNGHSRLASANGS